MTTTAAGTAREGMTMDTEHGEHREIARLIGDLRRAERERDDLAATLETRTAEHALAVERVRELEAIIAGRTTAPTEADKVAAWSAHLMVVRFGVRWHVYDAEGRPCAWLTAEVSR